MEEQNQIEKLQQIILQQQKVIVSANIYIGDQNTLLTLQKEYIETLEEQVKYYQLLKSSLWN
jgi:hypothetical protein